MPFCRGGAFSLPRLTAVFVGGHALRLAEALGEIAGRGKAHQLADLRQTVTGVAQHMLALLNAAAVQVSNGGNSVLPLEGVGQIVFVQVGKLCQQVQRDILAVVGVQIRLISAHSRFSVGAASSSCSEMVVQRTSQISSTSSRS